MATVTGMREFSRLVTIRVGRGCRGSISWVPPLLSHSCLVLFISALLDMDL